jgi:methylenetetrahydrofolate reductase (NADPH)
MPTAEVTTLPVPIRTPGCPKHMVYGPCGGVRDDLSCEMTPVPCPFAQLAEPIRFARETRVGTADVPSVAVDRSTLIEAARTRAVVLTDLSVVPFDRSSIAAVLSALAGTCDAVLVGEHQDRPDYPPTLMAQLITAAGHRPWITLTCRDRNRLVLEQEIAGLAQSDVDGVLCVTGDGRAPGIRPGVTQVFDLDGTRLTSIASSAGLDVAVPESPSAPPTTLRPGHLLQKQRAGARLAVLNHVRDARALDRFVRAARDIGVTIPLIASVAIYTDERSARVLQRFPGLDLDADRVEAVLAAADPYRAGIDAALAEAAELLAVDGIAGVNISGLASAQGELAAADVKAEVGSRIVTS